jgi:hypothetical protein
MTGVTLYNAKPNLAAQTAEAIASVRSVLAAVPMSGVFASALAAWVEIGSRNPAAAADIMALETTMHTLMRLQAERSAFSARPRRGSASRLVDLVVTDRGGTVPVVLALGAVADLALAAHGDAGRAAIRRVGEMRYEMMRVIGETITRSRG